MLKGENLVHQADKLAVGGDADHFSGQVFTFLGERPDERARLVSPGVDQGDAGVPDVRRDDIREDQVSRAAGEHGDGHQRLVVARPEGEHAAELGFAGNLHPDVLRQRFRREHRVGIHVQGRLGRQGVGFMGFQQLAVRVEGVE